MLPPRSCRAILLISVTFSLGLSQGTRPPEPEALGIVYHLDPSSGTLTPLERQVAKVILGAPRLFGGRDAASGEISGEKSPLRFSTDQKPEFVVRLAAGVDPNKFVLYLLQHKKGKRAIRYGTSGQPEGETPCRVTKFGEFSYKIMPDQDLSPGEYGFSPRDSNDVFAFGVDPPQTK
jgi:hypothetical protein